MKSVALIVVIAVVAILGVLLVILEKKNTDTKKLVLIAVMTAMSVAGRFIFALTPGFKPVTALVVLTGMYLGAEAGFLCGALTALVSNFYFGQGPWTPFQMLVWGILGLLAAAFSFGLKKSRILLMLYGIFAGIAFSLLMDVFTVLWVQGTFSWSYYLVCITAALPYTILYAVSNVIFLWVLGNSVGRKISHIVENKG